METNNLQIEVYSKIKKDDRINHSLMIDAVYKADPRYKNKKAEVLSKLMGVKNQSGFRYIGSVSLPKYIVIYSTGEDVYWRDEIDSSLGFFLYYGDNKTPGCNLHDTPTHGNEILKNVFDFATSNDFETRKKVPPIFVFKKMGSFDVKFLGLVVPGIKGKPTKDWLTAVWGQNKQGDRFQNYKSFFTILDTSKGCEKIPNVANINLEWLNDIEAGKTFESDYAPIEWKHYIKNNKYTVLLTAAEKFVKTKEEQLPSEPIKVEMLNVLQDYFYQKDKGYSFEQFAADLTEYMDPAITSIDVTRPYKDGGFDAIGRYKIFSHAENVVFVDFYLQAKCYRPGNPVVVKDTSRLISRIKDRQFGIMFTTSYVAKQAYEEILEDGHPIVIINGKNIIDYIFNDLEIRDSESLSRWLGRNY